MSFTISLTYTTVTPESSEHGDFEESGFILESATYTLKEISDLVQNYGIISRGQNDLTTWWESDYQIENYKTCSERCIGLHIRYKNMPLTPNQFRRLNKVLF